MKGLNLKIILPNLEIWKDLKDPSLDYPYYEVSNYGRVRNKSTKEIIKSRPIRYGYIHITLYFNGKRKNYPIHRIVAMVFIPNPKNKPQVNHKDGDKQNNRVDNLEWVTNSENMRHAYKNGLIDLRKGRNNYCEEDIVKICELIERGVSEDKIALQFGNYNDKIDLKRTITQIRFKKKYTHISDNFNFNIPSVDGKRYGEQIATRICEFLEKGLTPKQIQIEMDNHTES